VRELLQKMGVCWVNCVKFAEKQKQQRIKLREKSFGRENFKLFSQISLSLSLRNTLTIEFKAFSSKSYYFLSSTFKLISVIFFINVLISTD
jgi:hypothetical protein